MIGYHNQSIINPPPLLRSKVHTFSDDWHPSSPDYLQFQRLFWAASSSILHSWSCLLWDRQSTHSQSDWNRNLSLHGCASNSAHHRTEMVSRELRVRELTVLSEYVYTLPWLEFEPSEGWKVREGDQEGRVGAFVQKSQRELGWVPQGKYQRDD